MRSPRRKAKESLSINLIMATKHAHTPGVVTAALRKSGSSFKKGAIGNNDLKKHITNVKGTHESHLRKSIVLRHIMPYLDCHFAPTERLCRKLSL